MLYAALDIHKHTFQAAVLDSETGEFSERRFVSTREELDDWAMEWRGKLAVVALEATNGWRWVARRLQERGFEVRLVDPGRASALRGRRRRPKTDRLDARWLCLVLARQLLSECEAWMPPAEIQELRDKTRLRRALSNDHTRWAQRLHALLTHEGWPCPRSRLRTATGRRWIESLSLDPSVRAHVDAMLTIMSAIDEQLGRVEDELRRFAQRDPRCRALQTIYGVGPIIASHLLAEIGDINRFQRPRQLVRASGLDPTVIESADSKRRGRLAKQGSPYLRWALVEAAQHAYRQTSPDHTLYTNTKHRRGSGRARLTVARKIAHRAYHVLDDQAA
jgi:transposase